MWRPEAYLRESVLSFHGMGSGSQAQAISPGSKHLYFLVGHLVGPVSSSLKLGLTKRSCLKFEVQGLGRNRASLTSSFAWPLSPALLVACLAF